MIRIVIGEPGSCKTVFALDQICGALDRKRPVYTNIEGLSWFGGDLANILGLFPHLYFLHQSQAEHFWRHVEPGSLAVIDEFFLLGISGQHRNEFFECWFEEHYFAQTELMLIGQTEQSFAEFFQHNPNDCPVHRIVNPDRLHRFFWFNLLRHRFYGFYTGTVDNSYLFGPNRFDICSIRPTIACRWGNRRLFLLDRTLNRIKAFFANAEFQASLDRCLLSVEPGK